jgi:site-specific DNA recombinase
VIIAGRAHTPAEHKPHRSRHPYVLRGCVWCGVCERRMQSHWAHDVPYYRCRFPAEYALANRVQHPVNVYLREDQLIGEVTGWLAREFAPHRLHKTIADLAAAQLAEPAARPDGQGQTALKIAECDRKLTGTVPPSTRAQARPRSPSGSPRPKQKKPDTWPPGARAAHSAGG